MSNAINHLYEFGPYRIDATRRIFLRDEEPVPLTPKAFDTLLALVENSGSVVDKDELMKRVWPDTIVEEANLAQNIFVLRKALGERANDHNYIVTIPGRGYSFVADVKEVSNGQEQATTNGRAGASADNEESLARIETEAENEVAENNEARSKRIPILAVAVAVLVIALTALLYIWISGGSTQMQAISRTRSIAVLPFRSLVAGDGDESLELGMADALITKLSASSELVVLPTSAVRNYMGMSQDPLIAGRELKVNLVLEGSIQRSGDRIRITSRLLNVSDGSSIWAETFEEEFTHIFTLQDRISELVAGSLSLKLTGEQKEQLAKRRTENIEAFKLYVRGCYSAKRETTEGFNKAVEFLKQAIELDPNYAPAYAALSNAYQGASDWLLSPHEAMPKSREAAERALKLDPALPEAHEEIAWVKLYYDRDRKDAEREFKRLIELSPNQAEPHVSYGWYLSITGRHQEALEEIRRAQEIYPYSYAKGNVLYNARRFDEAMQQLQSDFELYPNSVSTVQWLGMTYEQKGMYKEALEMFQKAKLLDDTPDFTAYIGHVYARMGKRDEAMKKLRELKEMSGRRYVSPFYVALVHAGLGEREQVFEWLEKAYNEKSQKFTIVKVDPRFDAFRSDPRFADLMRRANIEP